MPSGANIVCALDSNKSVESGSGKKRRKDEVSIQNFIAKDDVIPWMTQANL